MKRFDQAKGNAGVVGEAAGDVAADAVSVKDRLNLAGERNGRVFHLHQGIGLTIHARASYGQNQNGGARAQSLKSVAVERPIHCGTNSC